MMRLVSSLLTLTFLLLTAAIPAPAVNAPERLTLAEILDGGCLLVWDPVPGASEYRIEIDPTAQYRFRSYRQTTSNELRVQGLANGQPTLFRVSAVKNGICSNASNVVRVVPEDLTAPPVPIGVNAMPGKSEIKLTWQPVNAPDFLHYTVYRSPEGKEKFEPLEADTGIVEPEFVDRHVKPGVNYVYTATATDRCGNESRRSAPVIGHTRFIPCVSFKPGGDRIHSHCFNPNDRSVYYTYAYEKDLTRWATWRRTVFSFPPPPGNRGRVKHLTITRNNDANVAVAIFPAEKEIYLCSELKGRWQPWRKFSGVMDQFLDRKDHNLTFDAIFHDRALVIACYDHDERRIFCTSTRNGSEFTPLVTVAHRVGFLPGEGDEISFSLFGMGDQMLKCLFLQPAKGQIFLAEIKFETEDFRDFKVMVEGYTLPPNF